MTGLSTILLAFRCAFISTNGERAIVTDSIPYHISKQQFLSEYGKDDTAKAVINYFFKQHKKAKKGIIPYSLISAAGTILYATTIAGGNAGTVIILGTIVIVVTAVSGALLLGSLIDLVKFSRKRLFKILDNYFSGKGIPRRLKKNLYSDKDISKRADHVLH